VGHPDGIKAMRDCVAAYQAAGFGRFEIETLEWPFGYAQDKPIGRAVIRGHNTFEAWMIRQHGFALRLSPKGQHPRQPVCAYSAGVLVGFVNVLAGRQDVVCVERACQAQGAESCLFELLPAEVAGDLPVVALTPDPALGRQLNLLEILFERMPMGIAIFDRDLRVRRFNPTWAGFIDRYSPVSASQVVPGVSFFELAPGTQATVRPVFERVLAGETVRQDAFRLEIGGIVSYWDAVLAPLVEDGDVVGIVYVTTDATERVLAHQELEARVEARTRELSTLLEISQNVASTLELGPLLGLILDQLKAVVDYSGATIFALEGEDLTALAHRGPIPQDQVLRLRFSLERARANREVIRRQAPVIIPDVRGDTRLARAFQETGGEELGTTFGYIRSWMGVPLMTKGRVMGMLTFDHSEPNYYSSRQAELAMALANQAALAMENAGLFEETRQRLAESQSLARVTTALLQKLALGEVLDIVCTEAQELTGAMGSTVFLLDAGREGWLRVAHSTGAASPNFERMPVEGSLTGMAVREGKPCLSNDPAELATPLAPQSWGGTGGGGGGEHPMALLAVPLRVKGSVIGALDMVNKPGGFTRDDVRISSLFADQAAIAIENARLYEQAQELAAVKERQRLARDLHDAVTQTLFSASLIAEVLPRLWERHPEEGRRRLEELRQLTRGALAEMRALLLELRPAALTETGLGDLLRQLAEAITGRARVPITVTVEGQRPLPPDVQVAFYRIAQEALNNVAKHASASQVTVSLRCLPPDVGGEQRGASNCASATTGVASSRMPSRPSIWGWASCASGRRR